MKYPLWEYYSKCAMSIYDIREHYLEHFYYQTHSRNVALKVAKTVAGSTKIRKLIEKTIRHRTAINNEILLNAINSIVRFWLRSNETHALAVMDAAIRWDVEVNSILELMTPEELKGETIIMLKKLDLYEELTKEEIEEMGEKADTEFQEHISSEENYKKGKKFKMLTWSLDAFIKEHGDLQVGDFENRETGEIFKSCVCVKGGTKTFISFSSKLGELTPEEIEKMRDQLVIVQLPSGKYSMAKPKKPMWRKVDI